MNELNKFLVFIFAASILIFAHDEMHPLVTAMLLGVLWLSMP